MQVERRRYPRYHVKENAFAVINPEPVRLVPILDIAMGGAGVFVNNEDQWLTKSSKLEIMVADCSFYLANIAFDSISDCRAFPADPSILIEGRRCSIKFGTLTPSQKSELKYFIRNHTQRGLLWELYRRFSKVLHADSSQKHSAPSCNPGLWRNLHGPTV